MHYALIIYSCNHFMKADRIRARVIAPIYMLRVSRHARIHTQQWCREVYLLSAGIVANTDYINAHKNQKVAIE